MGYFARNINDVARHILSLWILLLLPLICSGQPFQTDTLWIKEAAFAPVIDGNPSDDCWESIAWESISQVWIPWGSSVDSADFSGRYKVLWSSAQNLLYVLAEITDDIYVDGYVYKSSPENNNYPDYDLLEVFLDENASKGKHVFDGTGQTGIDWGYNAENAWSYHIMVNSPPDGDTTQKKNVCDIAGTNWSDEWIVNYRDHMPEFALSRQGNHYCWEFSLKVFDENYNPADPSDENRIMLQPGKIMGLSFAYCDNDEAGTTRDNFIGSVWVPEENFNDHWINADYFRAARLTGNSIPTGGEDNPENTAQLLYDPLLRELTVIPNPVFTQVTLYNMQGMPVQKQDPKRNCQNCTKNFSFINLPDGIYLVASESKGHRDVIKLIVY